MKKRVLLGLSGGVDSAVAAYMLLLQGYDVTGCFMRNWDSIANNDILGNPTLSGTKCSQELDYDDAAATAFELSIPILRKDFVDEYWKDVFQYFLDTYRKGYTPDAAELDHLAETVEMRTDEHETLISELTGIAGKDAQEQEQ